MTLSVKHTFQSAKGDPADATLVRPSNWNAEHTILCATDKLLGRTTAATGAVEEIAISDFFQTLLSSATLATLLTAMGAGAFTTGDVKLTIKTTADTDWVMCDDGTIGSATSGASTRANADCEDLFTLLWDNISDTYAAVTGGRGASAAADWSANKKIALTKVLGRALAVSGTGSGLSARTLGQTAGEETHVLTEAELAAHTHTGTTASDGAHTHTITASSEAVGTDGPSKTVYDDDGTTSTSSNGAHTHTFTSASTGSNTAHNNVQPTTFLNAMIKL